MTTWAPLGPSTCAHGMGWFLPCAACGRGYPSATVITNVPAANVNADLSAVLDALTRIEELLARLLSAVESV